jgi:hypothetical protein
MIRRKTTKTMIKELAVTNAGLLLDPQMHQNVKKPVDLHRKREEEDKFMVIPSSGQRNVFQKRKTSNFYNHVWTIPTTSIYYIETDR